MGKAGGPEASGGVPTIPSAHTETKMVGTAQERLCPPYSQNFTVMPEYSELSVQEPLLNVTPPTTAVQAKARL